MLVQQFIFYGLAALVAGSAVMVVLLNNPVRCALFLVLAFIGSAGLWILVYAEFLALVLILVYVGAVMTLFLFVIMMLNINVASTRHHFVKYVPFVILVVGLLVLLMVLAIKPEHFAFAPLTQPQVYSADYSNAKELGAVLYTQYVLAFELCAVLLLVAIIAAISLAHRGPQAVKTQHTLKQILVKRKDRVRLIKDMTPKSSGEVKPND